MLTNFTLKQTFYNVQHVLIVDTERKIAEYYSKVDSVIRPVQSVHYSDVCTIEKAEAWLNKSPTSLYPTRIEYLHAYQHVAT